MGRWPDDKPVALGSIMISENTVSCACPYCGSINEHMFEGDFFTEPNVKMEVIACWDCGREFVMPNVLFDEETWDDEDEGPEDEDVLEEDDDDGPPPMDCIDIDYFKMWYDSDLEED
jgi:hypothetical protein